MVSNIVRALYKTGFFKDVRLEKRGDVLVVVVTERPAISEISFSGNKSIESDALKEGLKEVGLAEGRSFDRSVLERIEKELERQYYNEGKYAVKLTSTVTPLERNRVAIDINVVEGATALIKQINIVGNEDFEDDDLLDEFLAGGDVFFFLVVDGLQFLFFIILVFIILIVIVFIGISDLNRLNTLLLGEDKVEHSQLSRGIAATLYLLRCGSFLTSLQDNILVLAFHSSSNYGGANWTDREWRRRGVLKDFARLESRLAACNAFSLDDVLGR